MALPRSMSRISDSSRAVSETAGSAVTPAPSPVPSTKSPRVTSPCTMCSHAHRPGASSRTTCCPGSSKAEEICASWWMRSEPRRASCEATTHSPPRRWAAVKRFCSWPGFRSSSDGRNQIWKKCAQSVRDALVWLWRSPCPTVRHWNSPACTTPEPPREFSYASAPSRT